MNTQLVSAQNITPSIFGLQGTYLTSTNVTNDFTDPIVLAVKPENFTRSVVDNDVLKCGYYMKARSLKAHPFTVPNRQFWSLYNPLFVFSTFYLNCLFVYELVGLKIPKITLNKQRPYTSKRTKMLS